MTLKEGDNVTAYWTNSGNNFSAHAVLTKVNRKSSIVTLTHDVHEGEFSYHPNALAYHKGSTIKFGAMNKWTKNNKLVEGFVTLNENIHRDALPKKAKRIPKAKIKNSLFDERSIDSVTEELRTKLNFPYVRVRVSSLGGEDNLSIILAISKDAPETWHNKIFENSRSAKMHISNTGVIEQISGWKLKLRKFTAKDMNTAITKINIIKDV